VHTERSQIHLAYFTISVAQIGFHLLFTLILNNATGRPSRDCRAEIENHQSLQMPSPAASDCYQISIIVTRKSFSGSKPINSHELNFVGSLFQRPVHRAVCSWGSVASARAISQLVAANPRQVFGSFIGRVIQPENIDNNSIPVDQ